MNEEVGKQKRDKTLYFTHFAQKCPLNGLLRNLSCGTSPRFASHTI